MRHHTTAILSLLIFALLPLRGFAQDDQGMRGEQNSYQAAAKNSLISSSGKKYSATMAGVDALMSDIKKTQPDLFSKLRPEYESMKSARTWHQILGWTLAVGGTALMVAAPQMLPDERGSKPSTPLVLGGAVGLIGGITLLFLTPPTASRIEEFKDLHNKYQPSQPLRFTIQATDTSVGGLAQFSF